MIIVGLCLHIFLNRLCLIKKTERRSIFHQRSGEFCRIMWNRLLSISCTVTIRWQYYKTSGAECAEGGCKAVRCRVSERPSYCDGNNSRFCLTKHNNNIVLNYWSFPVGTTLDIHFISVYAAGVKWSNSFSTCT
jgi:hypothetical protein